MYVCVCTHVMMITANMRSLSLSLPPVCLSHVQVRPEERVRRFHTVELSHLMAHLYKHIRRMQVPRRLIG